ncbi:hypothetical protein HMP0015_1965 [Acinetobacter haemolyticus ATCC 19194]|uniref:HEPN domain-containing protein n=1 Tax=Acinetobacter haemolyticus ATCC 19194 TaxID=707232 RepID=D4XQH3_ACIHA|nr:HEPN domain-containing protein [Acinetobacter haemolyticus]EFF82545.1 hypothetical protein HMP0015_1965 [Acinetobacter haemolyticus ATCC 19194]
MSLKIINRFEELIKEARQLDALIDSKITVEGIVDENFSDNNVGKFLEWKIKTKNIFLLSCGDRSIHFTEFLKAEKIQYYDTNAKLFKRLLPVLLATYDDLKNGFLISFKQIVQAEVFETELEQAKSLLENGYKNAAGVIAGVVLETAVKELCLNNNIDIERKKLTQLNDELAKASVYNKLQQKQITALADIRNNAAHGDYDQFTKEDVERMIDDIERFLLNHLS